MLKLKTKILLGLAVLLITALAVNLFYSYKIISEDKKTYIFENSLNQVEKLSNDLVGKIQNIIQNSNTYYYLALNAPTQLQNVINSQDFVAGFAFDQVGRKQSFIKSGLVDQSYLQNILLTQDADQKTLELVEADSAKFLKLYLNDNGVVLAYLLDLSFVDNLFTDFGIFKSALLLNGDLVLGQSLSQDLLGTLTSRSEEKVSYEHFDSEHQQMLISQARFSQLGLMIVSYAFLDDAFAFLNQLLLNSLYFGLIILGISLTLGLFFSLQVTKPIKVLTDMALAVAQGDYSKRSEINTRDEIKILGESFNTMSEEISGLLEQKEVMIKKLEDYGQNLEKMVEERTQQLRSANNFIQAMINSLDQGLFVIDEKLKCLPTYTKACEQLFDKSPEGLDLIELLGLEQKEQATLEKWAQILFSEKIPFDSAKGLGPKEKVFAADSPDSDEFKHIALNYFPMRDDEEKIENVVVVATDKTNEVKAMNLFEQKNAYVEMILKLIRLKNQFFKFIKTAEKMLEELSEVISLDPVDLDKCMFIYHSLNGGFGSFSLRELQLKARSSEQLIVDWRDSGQELSKIGPALREDFHQFCELFDTQKRELLAIFGDKSSLVEVDLPLVAELERAVELKDLSLIQNSFIDIFKRSAVKDYFVGYAELVATLSQKISKPMNPLEIIFGENRISKTHYEEFFSVLIHLFRNSMDHGIESSMLRSERNKPSAGTIKVVSEITRKEKRDLFILEISDDGGGIDPDLIKKVWASKHPDQPIDHLSDDEIRMKIFDPNFSTSEKLTDLSGRGVGMSSVKDVVDKLGGEIELESVVGKGTSFRFILPYY